MVNEKLGGGNSKFFLIFIPKPGEMIQFDEQIFQMGWNHQLVLGLGIRTVDGKPEIRQENQLSLVVYPIIYRVLCYIHLKQCRISEPSTVWKLSCMQLLSARTCIIRYVYMCKHV